MSNIVDRLKGNKMTFDLRYYGINDLATGWDIKRILENANEIKKYYEGKQDKTISNIDEYVDYLVLRKIIEIREAISLMKSEDDKRATSILMSDLQPILNEYQTKDVIRFLNTNIEIVFQEAESFTNIAEVTLDIIAQYQNGIDDNVFVFLINEHPYLLIHCYDKFQKRIEKDPTLLYALFDEITKTEDFKHNLKSIVSILSSLFLRNADLYSTVDDSVNRIITYGENILQYANEDNVIYYVKQFESIYSFLIKIKHVKANDFADYKKQLDELLNKYVMKHGTSFSYKIPVKKIRKMLKSDKPWEIKILQITHSIDKRGENLTCTLNQPPSEQTLIDMVSTNLRTNNYFTLSHQNKLDITLSVGGATISLMLSDLKFFDESLSCYLGLIEHICTMIDYADNDLEDDFKLLGQMLHNVYHSSTACEPIIKQSLCYGCVMFICAFLEKLLRTVYVNLKKNDTYIPANKATLGELLSDGNELFKTIFGEYQLRHLRYFFCLDKDGDVGYNFRNRLAHWYDISVHNMTDILLCELFYLLTCVVNSLLLYFDLETD